MFGMWLVFGYYIYLEVGIYKPKIKKMKIFEEKKISQGVFAALVDFAWLAYNTYCWQVSPVNDMNQSHPCHTLMR